jgi:glycosyltransferase involved in cell wall biosynthesis
VLYASGLDIKYLNYLIAILSSLSLIKRESKTKKFDMMLLYNIDEFTISIASYYWYRIKKIPMVLEYEDGVNVSGRGSSSFRQFIWQKMEDWLRSRLSGVICVNHNLSHRLANPNTYILPGVVDDDLCRMAKLRKSPLSGTPPYLALYSGSLTEGKGIQFIPKIANAFRGRIHFVITGEGPLYNNLAEAVKKSGGNVELLGHVGRDRLNQLLTSADFLLNPHEEECSGGISPFKLVEYLAAGGIVLTTKIGDLQNEIYDYCEIIKQDIQSAINVLEAILLHPEKAINRSKQGKEWALTNFSSIKVAKSLNRIVLRSQCL